MLWSEGVFLLDEDFEKRAYERQRARWEEDTEDLHRETAGVQGNRIARFKGDDADARLVAGKKRDADKDDLADFVLADILTTTRDMLTRRIDLLDRASLAALRETDEKLQEAREDLARLQAHAYQLPDGTRVYRTEDGTAVYDEDGKLVGNDVIEPADIPNTKTSWEQFERGNDQLHTLQRERDEIGKYRDRLDRARDELDDDDLSQDDLKDLEKDLETAMPATVRQQYDHLSANDPGSKVSPARTASAATEHAGRPGFDSAPNVADSFAIAASGEAKSPQPSPTGPATRPGTDFTV